MSAVNLIYQHLSSRLSSLRENTSIIDNPEKLNINDISDGILVVYATWSGSAMLNCTRTIQLLYDYNYIGKIIVIDTDCLTPDKQIEMFGQVCYGWGEIFVIHNGVITEQYLGKDSFDLFKTQYPAL